jgi:hypothetical protein
VICPDAQLGGIGRPVLASIVNRSYFLIGDLLLGGDISQDLKCAGPNLKKTIVSIRWSASAAMRAGRPLKTNSNVEACKSFTLAGSL